MGHCQPVQPGDVSEVLRSEMPWGDCAVVGALLVFSWDRVLGPAITPPGPGDYWPILRRAEPLDVGARSSGWVRADLPGQICVLFGRLYRMPDIGSVRSGLKLGQLRSTSSIGRQPRSNVGLALARVWPKLA